MLAGAYWAWHAWRVVPRAERAVDAAASERSAAIEAWSVLRGSHLFAQYEEAERAVDERDRYLGGIDEAVLLERTSAAAWRKAAGVQWPTLREWLRGGAQPKTRPDLPAASGHELDRVVAWVRTGFRNAALPVLRSECFKQAPCLDAFLARYEPALATYLDLRHAHADPSFPPPTIRALKRRPALFLRAFHLDVANGKGRVTRADVAMLGVLLDYERIANHNLGLYAIYFLLAAAVMGVLRLLSPRFVPRR